MGVEAGREGGAVAGGTPTRLAGKLELRGETGWCSTALHTSWLHSRVRYKAGPGGQLLWDGAAERAGHALRAGMTTQAGRDTRDCALLPARGGLLSATHCITSDLRGGARHLLQLRGAWHYCSPHLPATSLSCRAQYTAGWSDFTPALGEDAPPPALQFRGLTPPPSPTNSLLGVAALTSNLPLLTSSSLLGRHVKLHAFLSSHSALQPGTTPSCSAGLGLVARLADLARLELNLTLPLCGSCSQSRPGLAFSFGTEFL